MSWSTATWLRLMATASIVLAVFFFAPAVDAATCMPERPSAHAVVDHDAADGDHDTGGAEHGLCAHGHCHHGPSARPGGLSNLTPVFAETRLSFVLHDDMRASVAPDGLIRPPRV